MNVDELMKIYFSLGVLSSKVIPGQSVLSQDEFDRVQDRLVNTIKQE